ncbi:MAG TPA: hypothetical protein PK156_46380, partial [Polyangium sp.]|nr:hypothetical protein [Polyangium sp.]
NKKCDAISVGLGFEAEPAITGNVEPANYDGGIDCGPGEDPYSIYLETGCPEPEVSDAAPDTIITDAPSPDPDANADTGAPDAP